MHLLISHTYGGYQKRISSLEEKARRLDMQHRITRGVQSRQLLSHPDDEQPCSEVLLKFKSILLQEEWTGFVKNKSKEKSDERESVGFDFSMQKKIFSNSGRSRNLFNFKATKSVEDQEKEVPGMEILVFTRVTLQLALWSGGPSLWYLI